jgi:hypothetical protein
MKEEAKSPKEDIVQTPNALDIGSPEVDQEELLIYPGVPSEVVEELKEKYGIIFGTYFHGKPVLYRKFNIFEYMDYQAQMVRTTSALQKENEAKPKEERLSDVELGDLISKKSDELLVETFTVFPEGIMKKLEDGEFPGGAIYTLANSIMVNNAFVDLDVLVLRKEDVEKEPDILEELDQNLLQSISDISASDIKTEMLDVYKEVVMLSFMGKIYIVRGFTYDEYPEIRRMSTGMDPINFGVELAKRFVLYPAVPDFEEIPAGLMIKSIPDAVLTISGFSGPTPDIVIMD